MDILRFITAGNVDDGKSTLIGRLLFDTGNIKSDVLETVTGNDALNLAYVTDGLRSERTQGITIDVAYKYFTTPERKYIITDAPGHFQYTKNLVTGASSVDAMIILIDAQNGITEQTRRHTLVASFLKIGQVMVVVNKMDAIGFSESIFQSIMSEFQFIANILQLPNIIYIPLSALEGDNVTTLSTKMDWYTGSFTLLDCLATCHPKRTVDNILRFCVQYVTTDGEMQYCAGKVLSGIINVGDTISIYPEKKIGKVHKITIGDSYRKIAHPGQSVCLFVTSQYDISRGDLITQDTDVPEIGNCLVASICWLDNTRLQTDKEYILQMNSRDTTCRITEIISKTDVNSFKEFSNVEELSVNEFAKIRITTNDVIPFDSFSQIPANGRGIIIDPDTFYTSGAFIIL